MVSHSSNFDWKTTGTEEPGGPLHGVADSAMTEAT